jgi:hypothetical protein
LKPSLSRSLKPLLRKLLTIWLQAMIDMWWWWYHAPSRSYGWGATTTWNGWISEGLKPPLEMAGMAMAWNHPSDGRSLKPLLHKLLTWWLQATIDTLWWWYHGPSRSYSWGAPTTWNGWISEGLKPPLEMAGMAMVWNHPWDGRSLKPLLCKTFNYLVAVHEYDIIKVTSDHIKVLWLTGHHHSKWLDQWGFETATWNGWNSDGLKPSLRWQKFETSAVQTFICLRKV